MQQQHLIPTVYHQLKKSNDEVQVTILSNVQELSHDDTCCFSASEDKYLIVSPANMTKLAESIAELEIGDAVTLSLEPFAHVSS